MRFPRAILHNEQAETRPAEASDDQAREYELSRPSGVAHSARTAVRWGQSSAAEHAPGSHAPLPKSGRYAETRARAATETAHIPANEGQNQHNRCHPLSCSTLGLVEVSSPADMA